MEAIHEKFKKEVLDASFDVLCTTYFRNSPRCLGRSDLMKEKTANFVIGVAALVALVVVGTMVERGTTVLDLLSGKQDVSESSQRIPHRMEETCIRWRKTEGGSECVKPLPDAPEREDAPMFTEHIVQKGESVNAIARKYTVLPWQIRAANGMSADDVQIIHPGDTLYIPRVDWSSRVYVGQASWYGPNFHGKKRADGEVFHQDEILVAHRTLPLGLKLKIVNLQNNKTIIAKVQDRGPYAKDGQGRYTREIDLSRGAARKLGAIEPGVVPVLIKPLG